MYDNIGAVSVGRISAYIYISSDVKMFDEVRIREIAYGRQAGNQVYVYIPR